MKIQRIKLTFQKEHLHSVGEKSLVVLSQLAASPGPGVARLIFFGPPTTLFGTNEAPALRGGCAKRGPSAFIQPSCQLARFA